MSRASRLGLKTAADHYLLNGSKTYTSNGIKER